VGTDIPGHVKHHLHSFINVIGVLHIREYEQRIASGRFLQIVLQKNGVRCIFGKRFPKTRRTPCLVDNGPSPKFGGTEPGGFLQNGLQKNGVCCQPYLWEMRKKLGFAGV
jgi:hypothetical protein